MPARRGAPVSGSARYARTRRSTRAFAANAQRRPAHQSFLSRGGAAWQRPVQQLCRLPADSALALRPPVSSRLVSSTNLVSQQAATRLPSSAGASLQQLDALAPLHAGHRDAQVRSTDWRRGTKLGPRRLQRRLRARKLSAGSARDGAMVTSPGAGRGVDPRRMPPAPGAPRHRAATQRLLLRACGAPAWRVGARVN